MRLRTVLAVSMALGAWLVAAPGAAQTDVSEAQRSQIRELRQKHREATRATSDQLRDLYRQLREQALGAVPDASKISALRGQIAKAQADLATARVDLQASLAGVLTPEQRQRMRDRRGPGSLRGPRGRFGRIGRFGFDGRRFGRDLADRIERQIERRIERQLRFRRFGPRERVRPPRPPRFRRWMD